MHAKLVGHFSLPNFITSHAPGSCHVGWFLMSAACTDGEADNLPQNAEMLQRHL